MKGVKIFLACLAAAWIFSNQSQTMQTAAIFPAITKTEAATTTCGFGTAIASGVCQGFITSTSTLTWPVPSDWNNSSNTIQLIGAGGNGGVSKLTGKSSSQYGGGGGGGGAYAEISNLSLTTGGSVSIQVGVGGGVTTTTGATWFNGAGCIVASVCAAGGNSASGASLGIGGSNSFGSVTYAGGDGGGGAIGGQTASGGGGGAAGLNGAGEIGIAGSGTTSGSGGPGDAGYGGPGGTVGVFGGVGANGSEWGTGYGSGGGAAGTGASGGLYGGGGGGGSTAGSGMSGLIVVTYSPIVTISCSVSPTSTSFGNINNIAVFTSSSTISINTSCSDAAGCALQINDSGNGTSPGLYESAPYTHLIPSITTTLSPGTEGYGINAFIGSHLSGGPITIASAYGGTGNSVGGLSLTPITLASSTVAYTGWTIMDTAEASVSISTPPGNYSDTITYGCVGN